MPNWCNNIVRLTHSDHKMIERVAEAYSRGKLFSEFYPRPMHLSGTEACDWSYANWGTKWDTPGDEMIDPLIQRLDSESFIQLSFDTAWAPPIQFFTRLMADFNFSIEADWHESGMMFCGEMTDHYLNKWQYSKGLEGIPKKVIDLWQLDEVINVQENH